MNQSQAEAEEIDILSSKSSSFRGIARVSIKSIQLTHIQSRDIDKKNIKRLKEIFNKEGCFRLDPKNHIPVLVTEEELRHAQASASAVNHNLPVYPFLEFPDGALKCLHGQHRLLAASEYLDPGDQWWTVEFYTNASKNLKNYLSQDFENSLNISDGEIWRHIRICNKNGDDTGERKWWSRLTRSKERDLCQLLRHSEFRQAFDRLIDIPGLWVGLQLGTLHRFLTLKCDEELLHYLHHIHSVWRGIFQGHLKWVGATDFASVQSLQLRAPNSSRRDFAEIKILMKTRKILCSIHDKGIRGEILQNILATGLIPSISTFFEDLIHFENLANAMKGLIQPITKSATNFSMYRAFRRAFLATNGPLEVQVNEGMFRTIYSDLQLQLRMEIGYRQLWMYTMRHFPVLVSGATPRKESKQPKPLSREPNPNVWFEFAELALRLGFDSAKIQTLILEDPNKKIASAFLSNTRSSDFYSYDQRSLEEGAEKISQILRSFRKQQIPAHVPNITAEGVSRKDVLLRRSGRPFQFDYEKDKNCLFFDNFHREYEKTQEKEDISSFFVRRAFYFAFFGNINVEGSSGVVQWPQAAPPEPIGPEPETESPTPQLISLQQKTTPLQFIEPTQSEPMELETIGPEPETEPPNPQPVSLQPEAAPLQFIEPTQSEPMELEPIGPEPETEPPNLQPVSLQPEAAPLQFIEPTQSEPMELESIRPEPETEPSNPQPVSLQPEAAPLQFIEPTQSEPMELEPIRPEPETESPTPQLVSLQSEATMPITPDTPEIFDVLDILMSELPEYVDMEMTKGSEIGIITLEQNRLPKTWALRKDKFPNIIQCMFNYEYRFVDTGGFLITDQAAYIGLNPTHARLARPDIAKEGSHKNEEAIQQEEWGPGQQREVEAERVQREEVERVQREEAEREEVERKQREEAEKVQREEVEREEAEMVQREEAEREEAERVQREEAEKVQREEVEKVQVEREEAERVQREEAERKQKEEAERIQRETRLIEAEEKGKILMQGAERILKEEAEKELRKEEGKRREEGKLHASQQRQAFRQRRDEEVEEEEEEEEMKIEVQRHNEEGDILMEGPTQATRMIKVTITGSGLVSRALRRPINDIFSYLDNGYRIVDENGSLIQDGMYYLQSDVEHIRLVHIRQLPKNMGM